LQFNSECETKNKDKTCWTSEHYTYQQNAKK